MKFYFIIFDFNLKFLFQKENKQETDSTNSHYDSPSINYYTQNPRDIYNTPIFDPANNVNINEHSLQWQRDTF